MVPGVRAKHASCVMEMIPNRMAMAVVPMPRVAKGAIAQAWLNEFAQQVSWDDLKTWLRDCPRL